MSKIYRKYRDTSGVGFVFRLPAYEKFGFWLITLALIATYLTLLAWLTKLGTFWLFSWLVWSAVAITLAVRVVLLVRAIFQAGSLGRYISQTILASNVTKSLLETMSVNRMQDTPYVSVPTVTVNDSSPSHVTVTIERLVGMPDVTELADNVSSSFIGRFSRYAVTSSIASDDKLSYRFLLEDVATDKTFRPRTVEDMRKPSHVLTLQEGLEINLADRPHVAIWGRTGSGKSTLIISLLLQLFTQQGSDVRIIDGKGEFSAMTSVFYPADKVATTSEGILRLLGGVLELIAERQAIVAQGVAERRKMGLRAYDLSLAPVVVVADEIGAVLAGMDSKQKKEFYAYLTAILQLGRALGVYAVIGTQSPKADVLPTELRSQFATKILLGNSSGENQRMAFEGDVASAGGVEPFRGYFTCDGLTIQPMKFYVPDLHTHGLNELNVFEACYRMGLLKR